MSRLRWSGSEASEMLKLLECVSYRLMGSLSLSVLAPFPPGAMLERDERFKSINKLKDMSHQLVQFNRNIEVRAGEPQDT
ncbi:hypothetical protein DKX38_000377 [Salix brachista]|uniref:Uncharacterized protein n=1 Tax=Salix brachista TaxID=2182728 RepID=A0A5N5P277_9ROSI|nr:hypothetical protein DKX38_000377 [Salix brachista]